jgi:TRAP-type C4-dicarboxylate transport system permease small subunit
MRKIERLTTLISGVKIKVIAYLGEAMDRIIAIYRKCVHGICFVLEIIAAISLVGMFAVVFYNVIMRYFFHNSPGWAEEIARQLMVVFAFIGMALGVRDKIHIALTIVAERALKKILLPLEIFVKLLIFILGILMSSFMRPYFTILRYNRLPGSGIPAGYTYVFPTIVGALISLIALYQIYDHFKSGTDEDQKNQAPKKEGD